MSEHHLLGPFVRRFLLEEVVTERNLSLNTQKSYREEVLLVRHKIAPAQPTINRHYHPATTGDNRRVVFAIC